MPPVLIDQARRIVQAWRQRIGAERRRHEPAHLLQSLRCGFAFVEHASLNLRRDEATIWQVVQQAILLFEIEIVEVVDITVRDVAMGSHGALDHGVNGICVEFENSPRKSKKEPWLISIFRLRILK